VFVFLDMRIKLGFRYTIVDINGGKAELAPGMVTTAIMATTQGRPLQKTQRERYGKRGPLQKTQRER